VKLIVKAVLSVQVSLPTEVMTGADGRQEEPVHELVVVDGAHCGDEESLDGVTVMG